MKYILSFLIIMFCVSGLFSVPLSVHENRFDALLTLKRDYVDTDGIAWRERVLQGASRLVRKMVWGDDGLKADLEEAVLRYDFMLAASIFSETVDLWRYLINKEEEFERSLGEMKMELGFVNVLTGQEYVMEGKIKVLVHQAI